MRTVATIMLLAASLQSCSENTVSTAPQLLLRISSTDGVSHSLLLRDPFDKPGVVEAIGAAKLPCTLTLSVDEKYGIPDIEYLLQQTDAHFEMLRLSDQNWVVRVSKSDALVPFAVDRLRADVDRLQWLAKPFSN